MSNWYITPSDNDLIHYGVLGMKWGVRRYQNPDGSLTDKGKKRYGKNREKIDLFLNRPYPTNKEGSRDFNKEGGKLLKKAMDKKDYTYADKVLRKVAPYYTKDEREKYMTNAYSLSRTSGVAGFLGGLVGGTAMAAVSAMVISKLDNNARKREGIEWKNNKENEYFSMKLSELYDKVKNDPDVNILEDENTINK